MQEPVKNYIEFDNGKTMVYVQSCDKDWANVGVFINRGEIGKVKSAYYHIEVPGLKRNKYEQPKPGQLSHAEFDAIIELYKEEVLSLLEYLNGID